MARKKATNAKKKRPTIYDLAKMAEVSPGTVSRVLNNRDKVHPETREKVLQLAREIGLKPQASVRNREIAIVTEPTYHDRNGGYSSLLASYLSYELAERGIGVLMPSDPERLLPTFFLDGILAVTYSPKLLKLLETLETRIPVVYMDHFEDSPEKYKVCSDHHQAGYLAAKYLAEHGRTQLSMIGVTNAAPMQNRHQGFLQGITDAGLEPNPKLMLLDENTTFSTMTTRAVRNGADAFFFPGSSMQGIEGLHTLQYMLEKKVPHDISVIGGENEGISEFQTPPLTTISEPLEDMAKLAVELVLKLADGESPSERRHVLPVSLIERESV